MTEPQPLDLAPIQARCDAATEGPWAAGDFSVTGNGTWIADTCDSVDMAHSRADAAFIAHARQDVPDLIAEVLRLRADNAELTAELDGRDEKARKRWIKNQEKQLGIKYADFRAGRWEMDLAMGREMAAAYVAMAKTMLGDAPNYSETKLEFDVKIAESPETYTLVVQRLAPGALTPHEARQRAEYEAREWKAEAEKLRAELDRTRAELADAKAAGMREAAAMLRRYCPDHGPDDVETAFMDCHCAGADEIQRDATALTADVSAPTAT